ncbi:MAG TPA: lipoyl(octanoyl) transferase LipB [Candidatus Omnitrophota bacterium]|nr:lipoyl(octanoyl) transferase LipB [Candidatus Omnitrophota bacterium]HRZ15095.1 lipoyl(octanoyl) transferase LipB [Candidatus Omnitrophota bacterium]
MFTEPIRCDRILDAGLLEYAVFERMQEEIRTQVRSRASGATAIVCRHYPVITCGRSSSPQNLLMNAEQLAHKGIAVRQVRRGGDVTYHGPGQLCVYPVLDLRTRRADLHYYLRSLEAFILGILGASAITGERKPGLTGVWVGGEKIASIGISVHDWITGYGCAINVSAADLKGFACIRPCGMDIRMTSMETVLGHPVDISEIVNLITRRLSHDTSYCSDAR